MVEINKFNKIIVANWKLNGSLVFIRDYFEILNSSQPFTANVCGIICPPAIYLPNFNINIPSFFLGAQNCSNYDLGPYTGEISVAMILESNCEFCIIGHSERRGIFNETSRDIKIKAHNLINSQIHPIICIGESLDERKKGITREVIKKQIVDSLPKNASNQSAILAYEPIWAIGTGLTPTLEEIEDIHFFIKNEIEGFKNFKILYGGSVNRGNSKEIMNIKNVDGVLVGGASLNPLDFVKILNF